MRMTELKQVSLNDLNQFLTQDELDFSTLNVSLKHIVSTNRLNISLSKNSAHSFYHKETVKQPSLTKPIVTDDCLTDAQNCEYFQFFYDKKKSYTRYLDKIEANFEGKENNSPTLFFTLTFNTQQDNLHI